MGIDNYQPNAPHGNFGWGTESGHPFADFLFGVMNTGNVSLQNAMVQTRAWSYSLFVQDDFKMTPTLTLNLGLRWQRDQSVREKNNALAFFNTFTAVWEQFGVNAPPTPFDPSKKQFAPRISPRVECGLRRSSSAAATPSRIQAGLATDAPAMERSVRTSWQTRPFLAGRIGGICRRS